MESSLYLSTAVMSFILNIPVMLMAFNTLGKASKITICFINFLVLFIFISMYADERVKHTGLQEKIICDKIRGKKK